MHPTPYFTGRQLAHTPGDADLQGAFALRYSVYCLECGFIDPRAHPDGLESDGRDRVSAHFAAYDHSQALVGYVRLVPPDAHGQLPWELRCATLCDGVALPPREGAAEISRLMVREDYRRRRGDLLSGVARPASDPHGWHDRRSTSPQILLTLYRQMYLYSITHGITHWYAAMERSLARSLRRLHFAFRQIGAEADYFGPVAPYLAELREMESRLAAARPDLLAWMQDRAEAGPLSVPATVPP